MATFWEIAAHPVDHNFSLYFDYLYYLLFPVLVLRAGFAYFFTIFIYENVTMMDSLESIASCGQQLGLYKLNKKIKFTLPLFSHISDKNFSMKIILISNVSVFNFQ